MIIFIIWLSVAVIALAITNYYIDKDRAKGHDVGGAPFVQMAMLLWPMLIIVAIPMLSIMGLTSIIKKIFTPKTADNSDYRQGSKDHIKTSDSRKRCRTFEEE